MPFAGKARVPFVELTTGKKDQESQRSHPLISELSISYLIDACRHASPEMRHVFFVERVLRASRSKRVTTLQLRRVSRVFEQTTIGTRSRNFVDIVARFARRPAPSKENASRRTFQRVTPTDSISHGAGRER